MARRMPSCPGRSGAWGGLGVSPFFPRGSKAPLFGAARLCGRVLVSCGRVRRGKRVTTFFHCVLGRRGSSPARRLPKPVPEPVPEQDPVPDPSRTPSRSQAGPRAGLHLAPSCSGAAQPSLRCWSGLGIRSAAPSQRPLPGLSPAQSPARCSQNPSRFPCGSLGRDL